MKRRYLFTILLVLVFLLVGCGSSDSRTEMAVEDQQNTYIQNQPIPQFDWSLERDVATQLYIARNEAYATYSVITSQGTGTPISMCPSIGYPIPYDVQLTNPLKTQYSNGAVIEQAEPNGLFSSKNSDATWVMCVNEDGQVMPVYTEQKVSVYPYAVKVQDGMIVPVDGAIPSFVLDVEQPEEAVPVYPTSEATP